MKQLSADAFQLDLGRDAFVNDRRGNEIWFVATQDGDLEYKRAVQQSKMNVPRRNDRGAEQHITFAEVTDASAVTKELGLVATSDAGVPVHFTVLAGPANPEGDTLRFSDLPPRAKLPLAVTVVARQRGHTAEPALRSAEPAFRTFKILPAK